MMSAICHNFVQNTWKRDLCSNCFKSKEDHEFYGINNNKNILTSQRYLSQATTIYQARTYYTQASNNWKNLIFSNQTSNGLRSPQLLKTMTADDSQVVPNGDVIEDDTVKSGDLSSVRLVQLVEEGTSVDSGNEHSSPDSSREGSLNGTSPGILKVDGRTNGTTKPKSTVKFQTQESEVIGYGGDVCYSSDDDTYSGDSGDSDDDSILTEEEKDVQKLTDKNTNYNSLPSSLQQPSKDGPRWGRMTKQPSNREEKVTNFGMKKHPPLVSVRPFVRDTTPTELKVNLVSPMRNGKLIFEQADQKKDIFRTPYPKVNNEMKEVKKEEKEEEEEEKEVVEASSSSDEDPGTPPELPKTPPPPLGESKLLSVGEMILDVPSRAEHSSSNDHSSGPLPRKSFLHGCLSSDGQRESVSPVREVSPQPRLEVHSAKEEKISDGEEATDLFSKLTELPKPVAVKNLSTSEVRDLVKTGEKKEDATCEVEATDGKFDKEDTSPKTKVIESRNSPVAQQPQLMRVTIPPKRTLPNGKPSLTRKPPILKEKPKIPIRTNKFSPHSPLTRTGLRSPTSPTNITSFDSPLEKKVLVSKKKAPIELPKTNKEENTSRKDKVEEKEEVKKDIVEDTTLTSESKELPHVVPTWNVLNEKTIETLESSKFTEEELKKIDSSSSDSESDGEAPQKSIEEHDKVIPEKVEITPEKVSGNSEDGDQESANMEKNQQLRRKEAQGPRDSKRRMSREIFEANRASLATALDFTRLQKCAPKRQAPKPPSPDGSFDSFEDIVVSPSTTKDQRVEVVENTNTTSTEASKTVTEEEEQQVEDGPKWEPVVDVVFAEVDRTPKFIDRHSSESPPPPLHQVVSHTASYESVGRAAEEFVERKPRSNSLPRTPDLALRSEQSIPNKPYSFMGFGRTGRFAPNSSPRVSRADTSKERKKPGRFSWKRLLKLGAGRGDGGSGGKTSRVEQERVYENVGTPQRRPRPVIIHPLDLNRSGVEVIAARSPETIVVDQQDRCPSVQSDSSFSTVSTVEGEETSNRWKDTTDSPVCDHQPITVTPISTPPVLSTSSFPLGTNSAGRPKPPPPPRTYSLDHSPSRPPPPQSQQLRERQKSPSPRPPVNTQKGETVYANIGEIRSNMAPQKPERSASLKEGSPESREIRREASPESMKRPAPPPPIEPTQTQKYEQVPASPVGDMVTEDGYIVPVQRSSSLTHHSSIIVVPGPSPEEHLYSSISPETLMSRSGEEENLSCKSSDSSLPRLRTNRLSLRKGRSVVHRNLEENYGAVISANHEALTQILDQIYHSNPTPSHLHALRTNSSVSFSEFSLEKNDSTTVTNGKCVFYPALWSGHKVLLMMTTEILHSSVGPKMPFSLSQVSHFTDLVSTELLPWKPDVREEMCQVFLYVLPDMQVETLQTFRHQLSSLEDQEREICFVLLQLINALKHLQAQGVEEVGPRLENFILTREDKDTNFRLLMLGDGFEGGKVSLCRCALEAMTLLDATISTDSPAAFATMAEILRQEKAVSLSRVKAALEYMLWGPSGVMFDGKEQEQPLQRWLDLERANFLNNLIRSQGVWHVHLSVFEEYHLLFLVRTCAKVLREASIFLDAEATDL